MKNFRYAKWYKALLLIFQGVFVMLLSAVVVAGVFYSSGYNGFYDILQNKSFLDSDYFAFELEEEMLDIMKFVKRSENFETEGRYDSDKTVDIVDYVENQRITGENTGSFTYSLDELIEWAQEGPETETVIICKKADGSFDYYEQDEFDELVSGGQLLVEGYETEEDDVFPDEDYLDEDDRSDTPLSSEYLLGRVKVKNGEEYIYSEAIEGLKERKKALTKDGNETTLYNYVKTDEEANGNLRTYTSYMKQVLDKIEEEVFSYKDGVEKWKNSNFTYIFKRVTNDQVYTNQSAEIDGENIESRINDLKKGIYYTVTTQNLDIDSNAPMDKNAFYRKTQVRNDDYTLGIYLDITFPVKDSLYEAKLVYEKLQPWFRVVVALAVISVIGYIFTMVELTLRAGRREKNGEVILNRFDKIFTEFAAILVFGGMAFSLIFLEDTMYNYDGFFTRSMVGVGSFSGAGVFVLNAVGIIGYLSFVRRLKSKTLWTNSIVGIIINGMKSGYDNRKITTKVFLTYAGFVIINMLLFINGYENIALVYLALIIDIAIGIIIMREAVERKKIKDGVWKIAEGNVDYKIDISTMKSQENIVLGTGVNNIGDGLQTAVKASMKNERLKTDLITNVSHDIKTPLTSIINYVHLLRRENIENETVKGYIDILEQKSERLKHLTEDLVEASKISSGNIKLYFEKINFVELVHQTAGEFDEKFVQKNLQLVMNIEEQSPLIYADGRRIWRVLENLYGNVAKYAMENTRVYVDIRVVKGQMEFSIKNISKFPLNIHADELTERFIRGDISRSTEGSGLGLSIAKNLTELQKGEFDIYLDGDLFKVIIRFPVIPS